VVVRVRAGRPSGPGYRGRRPAHSLARNHALIDGDKRLACYGLNGRRLRLTNDAAYDLVMSVAAGELETVGGIAEVLTRSTGPWR
jgi:death-on-curing protein